MKTIRVASATLLLVLATLPLLAKDVAFDITARKFEFNVSPGPFVVAVGDRVTLRITSLVDENTTHGFVLPPYVGEQTLLSGVTRTVTFTATDEGTFNFFCTVSTCGEGHGDMEGDLIVKTDADPELPPSVDFVEPDSGPESGGTVVKVEGADFVTGAKVVFGGVTATGTVVESDSKINTVTPPHAAGLVDVVVTNPDLQSGTKVMGFNYLVGPRISSIEPAKGPAPGGTAITIRGTDFAFGATVELGAVPAVSLTLISPTMLTGVTPAHQPGIVDVVVKNPDGQTGTLERGFSFEPAPTLATISPNRGSTAGANPVSLSGSGFTAGCTVTFGGAAATQVNVTSPSALTLIIPAHAAGTVDVVVKNPDGQTGSLAGGFTFLSSGLFSVSPTGGPASGGNQFTVHGAGFVPGATVMFGGVAATGIVVTSSTAIVGVVPAHDAGSVDVVVRNPDSQTFTLPTGYTYSGKVNRRRAVRKG